MFQFTRRACLCAIATALLVPGFTAHSAEDEKPSSVIDPAALIAKGAKATFVFQLPASAKETA